MKALLVNPKVPDAFWSAKEALTFSGRKALLPPLGLITVAALLPPSWQCRLIDMNVEPLRDEDLAAADVVLLTGMLVQRVSLQDVIGRCRSLGVTTVVGGPCVTAEPDEFPLADRLALGEAEGFLPALAAALENGSGPRVFRDEKKPDLADSPIPRFDLLAPRAYLHSSLQFSRGCPFSCEFCDIVELFGRKPRVKSPRQIINELEAIRKTGFTGDVFFVDDNFIGNRHAVQQILPEISHWRRRTKAQVSFYTEASMNLAEEPALVDAMVDAGFFAVFLGLETPNPDALLETGKHQNLRGDPIQRIHSLMSRGLDVWGGFILGFDSDGPDIFDRMIEFVRRASIPVAMVGLLGALPGTQLFKRLQREGRLRWKGFSAVGDQFGLTNVINRLPVQDMLEGYRRVMATLYSPAEYFQRCRDNLARWVDHGSYGRKLSLSEIRAGIRAFFQQGLVSAYRHHYWRFLAWTLRHQPRKLARAISQAAAGHHYITYTRKTVLPSLDRTRAALCS